MDYKTIVVLAKSNKCSGYCVAGRELYLDNGAYCLGPWVRLVSSDKDSKGAIFDRHFQLTEKESINVLDVVFVAIDGEQIIPGQPDNLLINESNKWTVQGRVPAMDVSTFIDKPMHLWQQDDVESHVVSPLADDENYVPQSLYLIKPANLVFTLSHDWNDFYARFEKKIRVSFSYNDQQYNNLAMTDPKVKRMLGRQHPKAGEKAKVRTLIKGDNYYLCVSLSPRFGTQQLHYKIVATVFDFDGYLQGHYC